jgi:hypothetical protein
VIRAALAVACLAAFLSACAFRVKLVGDYDALIDQSVLALQSSTNEFFALYESTEPTKGERDAFFARSLGAIEAMTTRATVLEDGLERHPLTTNFHDLKAQFEDARQLDLEKKQLRDSSLAALNESFKALQVQLVWMKKTQTQKPGGE